MGKRSVTVLRDLNLTVERGDFLALRGASGAGKSTLLHLLGGLDSPTRGNLVCKPELAALTPGKLAHVRNFRIGFVFQAYHLLPELDALENVCLPARIARLPARVAEARGRELLDRVGWVHAWNTGRPSYPEANGSVSPSRARLSTSPISSWRRTHGQSGLALRREIIELLCALRQEKNVTLVIATHDDSVARGRPKSSNWWMAGFNNKDGSLPALKFVAQLCIIIKQANANRLQFRPALAGRLRRSLASEPRNAELQMMVLPGCTRCFQANKNSLKKCRFVATFNMS